MNHYLSILLLIIGQFIFATTNAQENVGDKDKVLSSINEIISSIDESVDTIYHIDQINSILNGKYAKLSNLIEYYKDLGGEKEKCQELQTKYSQLGKRLNDRKEGLDTGNFVNLKLKKEVESEIRNIYENLENAALDDMYTISRAYRSIRIEFDVWMKNNSMMDEWKASATNRLDLLKQAIDKKQKELDQQK